jgi:group II intron reverse transcriptase/maturase/CRISPR-associated endonuclease Cas1
MDLVVVAPELEAARGLIAALRPEAGRHLVLDYAGTAERVLAAADRRRLAGRTFWLDLADIRCPRRLLDVTAGLDESLQAMERLVARWAHVLGLPLLPGDASGLRLFVGRLLGADGGNARLRLADVRAVLAREEVCRWAWPGHPQGGAGARARRRVLAVLDGALRYPHVAAVAAAPATIPEAARDAAVLWCELPGGHLEVVEAQLLAVVLHRLAEDAGRVATGASATPVAGRSVLFLVPPVGETGAPQIADVVARLPAGAARLALRAHPSGRPPQVLGLLRGRDRSFRLEVAVRGRTPAAPWRDLLGGAANAFDANPAGRIAALGFDVTPVRVASAPARTLDGRSAPGDEGFASLRRSGRQGSVAWRQPEAAVSIVPRVGAPPGPDPYERLCDEVLLRMSWFMLKVSGRHRSAGVDGELLTATEDDFEGEIGTLVRELRQQTYQPLPPRRFAIAKPDGGERRIGVLALRDRLVQRAFLLVVQAYFEPFFSDRSFGFRPLRNPHQMVLAVAATVRRGLPCLAHVDVASCFDTLPHDVIVARFAERVPSRRMTALLQSWLRAGLGATHGPRPDAEGVVQGALVSPFLSNVVLDELDHELEAARVEFFRFADDLALVAASPEAARDAVSLCDEVLRERFGMRLNPDKTTFGNAATGIDLLGFRLLGETRLAVRERRHREARDDLLETTRALARRAVAPGPGLRHLALQFQGIIQYFCALGVTPAIERQLAQLRTAVEAERQHLPPMVAAHEGWAALPDVGRLVQRFGTWEAVPPAAPPGAGPYGAAGARPELNPRRPWAAPLRAPIEPVHEAPGAEEAAADDGDEVAAAALATVAAPEVVGAAEELAAPCPEVIRDGRLLTILRSGVAIRTAGDDLHVVRSRRTVFVCRLAELDLVLVQTWGASIGARTAWTLADRDVAVVFACPAGDEIAVLATPASRRASVRARQARGVLTPRALRAGLDMIRAKVANQAALLRYLARAPSRRGAPVGAALESAAAEIRASEARLADVEPDLAAFGGDDLGAVSARLMGHEGRAAASYWTALGALVGPGLAFPGRRTRGASDPVNLALNYAYGILYAQVWRAVVTAGLDPGIGIVHQAPRSPGGLVYDLVEELRAPLADRVVFSLLGHGFLPAARPGDEPALGPRERHVVTRAVLKGLKRPVRHGRRRVLAAALIREQVFALRAVLLGEAESYPAFRFRW